MKSAGRWAVTDALADQGSVMSGDHQDYVLFGHERKKRLPQTVISARSMDSDHVDQIVIASHRGQVYGTGFYSAVRDIPPVRTGTAINIRVE